MSTIISCRPDGNKPGLAALEVQPLGYLSIERFTELLSQAAAALPQALFAHLNLGIGVLEQAKVQPATASGIPAYILGEYQSSRSMGRGIVFYYGSFKRVYPHLQDDEYAAKLISDVLKHELTHHLESQAGSRELEIEDARKLLKM